MIRTRTSIPLGSLFRIHRSIKQPWPKAERFGERLSRARPYAPRARMTRRRTSLPSKDFGRFS
ncbi:MAG: hypothetical protein VW338_17635, partial [Rhodospirillaceae bacterium]